MIQKQVGDNRDYLAKTIGTDSSPNVDTYSYCSLLQPLLKVKNCCSYSLQRNIWPLLIEMYSRLQPLPSYYQTTQNRPNVPPSKTKPSTRKGLS